MFQKFGASQGTRLAGTNADESELRPDCRHLGILRGTHKQPSTASARNGIFVRMVTQFGRLSKGSRLQVLYMPVLQSNESKKLMENIITSCLLVLGTRDCGITGCLSSPRPSSVPN